MKWVLVYIVLNGLEPYAINAMGHNFTFVDMYDCFEARDTLSLQVGGASGTFPAGKQAVCIPTSDSLL